MISDFINGKTLYLSDLDGTLLDASARLTEYTVSTLTDFIGRGGLFSVATARSAATALQMLDRIPLKLPIILMNGVFIYDPTAGKYLKTEFLSGGAVAKILAAMRKIDVRGLLYTLEDSQMRTYYEERGGALDGFMRERERDFGKRFIKANFDEIDPDRAVYFCYLDRREVLLPLREAARSIGGIRCEFYESFYEPGNWYLELFSESALKKSAAVWLKNHLNCEKLIVFGDGSNDIPMFEVADRAIAVANALPEIRAVAHEIIGGNTEDGVARWLEELGGDKNMNELRRIGNVEEI